MVHQTEEQLELYALGRLPESSVAAVEEHLLVCDICREKLDKAEEFAISMRSAIADEPLADEKGWLTKLHFGRLWFADLLKFTPLYAGAIAAILVLAAVYVIHPGGSVAPVAAIELTAMRGDMRSVKAARETDITLADATSRSGIPAEVVDAGGSTVWRGVLTGDTHKLQILKQLTAGSYFVRLYDERGALLHEYGFRVL